MPRFNYSARERGGELQTGVIEAVSADAVAAQLASGGLIPIRIEAVSNKGEAQPQRLPLWNLRHRVTLDDLILFSRQMYTLARSGVPIIRALRGLTESTRNPILVEALVEVRESLEAGRELSSAMAQRKDVFPLLFSSIVQVGEGTGRIAEAFLQIGNYLDRERDLRRQVRSALRYPTIVVIAVSVAIAIISLFVIPAFEKLFTRAGGQLPLPTRIILGISHFARDYWGLILAATLLAAWLLRRFIATDAGRLWWDRLKLRLPLAGNIVQRATLARFARAFAMGYAAGIPLVQALMLSGRSVDNRYVESRVVELQAGVERGETLTGASHKTGMFTPLVLQMMAVGEESGAVDEMLLEVAGYYEREVEYDLKALSSYIEPIMIVVLGGMVLILALGVFLPMWNMASVMAH